MQELPKSEPKSPRFDPVLPAHAIERCALTVIFDQPLPSKPFGRVVADLNDRLDMLRLVPATPGVELEVDIATGRIAVKPQGQNPTYTTPDGASTLHVSPAMVAWQTTRYVRWTPFRGQIDRLIFSMLPKILKVVSIKAVKLEYWDRFVWTGTQADIDPWRLLRKDGGFVVPLAVREGTTWHSHCGWYELPSYVGRRLVNINVDAVDLLQPGRSPVPSIGIYTMMQQDVRYDDTSNLKAPIETVDQLHIALKQLLGSIIESSMVDRIALNPEKHK